MALFEDKKQIFILIAAVATGLIAAVLVSNFVQSSITTETNRIASQFQKKQQEKDEQYQQQMQALNQKIAEVEERAQQAVQQAAQQAAKAAAIRPVDEGKKEKKFVSLALRMPAGKRALTLRMDSLGAVGGLVNPGDYVDIISHLNVPARDPKDKDRKDSVTAMIFQNIQILAINTNIDQPGVYDDQQKDSGLKITFAVTPEEASLLAFAEKNGKLELALRSPKETKPAMISAATWSTLAEYVLQNTGAELRVPDEPLIVKEEKPVEEEEPTVPKVRKKTDPYDPSIVVIKGGKGAN
jgi:Flp pilus assembly protein CpaB